MEIKDYDYSAQAEYYDVLESSPAIENFNKVLDKLLKDENAHNVLDMTCGTGTQAIYLHNKGYKVTASDFSRDMIGVATKKNSEMKFLQADMRTTKLGKFDAVISIFNAIGHLSKEDFKKAILNIKDNLKEEGIYIFDIFNFDFMKSNFIDYEFMDVCKEVDGTKYARFNKNSLDKEKQVMNINQETFIQKGIDRPLVFHNSWDLQIYSSEELKSLLKESGFKVLKFLNMEGEKLNSEKDLFILTVARKI